MQYPKEIVLIRHGESEGNILTPDERSIFNLSTKDYPLTQAGREQARKARDYIRTHMDPFDALYTSFCKRAKDTMRIMFPRQQIREDARIAEVQRGIWHAMSEQEVTQSFPFEDRRRQREGLYYYRPLGGENWPDLEIRIHNFIEYICRVHNNERIALCVHGHWLIVFQKIIHGFTVTEALRRYKDDVAPNGSITSYKQVIENGKPILQLRLSHHKPRQFSLSKS